MIVRDLVREVQSDILRLGTRKLYYLLSVKNLVQEIKVGRDGLFDYLKSEHMQVKPKIIPTKRLIKTTGYVRI